MVKLVNHSRTAAETAADSNKYKSRASSLTYSQAAQCPFWNEPLGCCSCLWLQLSLSSAAIEPVFTKFGVAQTKLRNQVGVEKAAGLAMSCRELSGKSELDWSLK
jgi:hypothetical protein